MKVSELLEIIDNNTPIIISTATSIIGEGRKENIPDIFFNEVVGKLKYNTGNYWGLNIILKENMNNHQRGEL